MKKTSKSADTLSWMARRALVLLPVFGLGLGRAGATLAPLQLPGHGSIVGGSATYSSSTPGVGTVANGAARTAINWGSSGGTLNVGNSGTGFNIGSSAILNFTGHAGAVLNVDTSGNPSLLMGTLNSAGNIQIFVANANGITVGSTGVINAPAGLGLVAGRVNASSWVGGSPLAIGFAQSGPLTVQGNLQGTGHVVLFAGSGNVNVSPVQGSAGNYFSGTTMVRVIGGVGGIFSGVDFHPADGAGSPIHSAPSATTVTLNLGTSTNPFSFEGTHLRVWSLGNIVNNGVLDQVASNPAFEWTGTFTNSGTLYGSHFFDVHGPGTVSFHGNGSSALLYGGLTNDGVIGASHPGEPLVINLPGTVINNSTGTIGLAAGNVSETVIVQSGVIAGGGAILNYGTIQASDTIHIQAANFAHTGPYPNGGVFSNGSILLLSNNASDDGLLQIWSSTGNVGLQGRVAAPYDANGIGRIGLASGGSEGLITVATNLVASSAINFFTLGSSYSANVQGNLSLTGSNGTAEFFGGAQNITGPGTVTANRVLFDGVTGNINNRVGTNPLQNGFHIANGPGGNTAITISAVGTSPQAINLNVAGNATVNSGRTATFTHADDALRPVPNTGSNLLVQASGNLTVVQSGSEMEDSGTSLSAQALHIPNGFVFPGGIVLIAGTGGSGTLALNTVVDNGYTTTAVAGQGIFFQAPTILSPNPVVTNGNTWVNFSVQPSVVPAIYGVATTASSSAYTLVPDSGAFHIRSYSP
ncbi:MAG: filamentous hemagglutinin N-terminal domain-containing protein [Methylacidiphilaceae bacterium]|nr:filamentous hemagglutinin N-terminal domain-containing protein [Candidatus Methylacidiphilaceae bacterium]